MNGKNFKLLTILLLFPSLFFGNNDSTKIDSLKTVIDHAKHDTDRVKAYKKWDDLIYISDPNLDLILNQKLDSICRINLQKNLLPKEKQFFKLYRGIANTNFGIISRMNGNLDKAFNHYLLSSSIYRDLNKEIDEGRSYNNIGNLLYQKGNYQKAIEYYLKAKKIFDKSDKLKQAASSTSNLASIYFQLDDFEKSLEYYNECLEIDIKLNDQNGIASSYYNIGNIYREKKYISIALEFYFKSKDLFDQLKNNNHKTILAIGEIYFELKDYEKALEYFNLELTTKKELDNSQGISAALNRIGNVYFQLKEYKKAEDFFLKSMEIADRSELIHQKKSNYESLYKVYKKLKKFKKSLEMSELKHKTEDYLNSKENQKEIIRLNMQYEYEKEALADSIKNAEQIKIKDALLEAEQAKNRQQKQQKLFLFIGIGVILFLVIFISNRLRISNNQNKIIEKQKRIVENVNHEITESINYAKRLQLGVIQSSNDIHKYNLDSFIFIRPKDNVSGDFYWFNKVNNVFYLAAADCTGHGVPGAMVSFVCSNALNRTVMEFGLKEPSEILNQTREIIIDTFSQRGEKVKDGMDISLCAFKENEVSFAGANNPLWIVRKTDLIGDDKKSERSTVLDKNHSLIEFKANKQPVGFYAEMREFTQENIKLHRGDTIYLFSDGFADQFGGEKGKKYKYKPFKQLLINIQDKTMKEQKNYLSDVFDEWKGNREQIDDVCIIGFKV